MFIYIAMQVCFLTWSLRGEIFLREYESPLILQWLDIIIHQQMAHVRCSPQCLTVETAFLFNNGTVIAINLCALLARQACQSVEDHRSLLKEI